MTDTTAAEPVVSALRDGIPSAKVLVFADDPERKPRLYACPKCGSVHSPAIYLATEERKHEAAREAAENCYSCKTNDICKHCGCETPKGWLACESCRFDKALEKAVEVPDDGGPYCAFAGDTYFNEIDEARDADVEWVSPCNIEYPKIDADGVIDGVLSDMHEDADVDDLNGIEDFYAAVKKFNDAQTARSWFGDNQRKINVAQAIEARSGKTGTGLTENA